MHGAYLNALAKKYGREYANKIHKDPCYGCIIGCFMNRKSMCRDLPQNRPVVVTRTPEASSPAKEPAGPLGRHSWKAKYARAEMKLQKVTDRLNSTQGDLNHSNRVVKDQSLKIRILVASLAKATGLDSAQVHEQVIVRLRKIAAAEKAKRGPVKQVIEDPEPEKKEDGE